jgi:predicted nucleotidyltransferase
MEELKGKYAPHTIILYGSYARNEATETSDVDIAFSVIIRVNKGMRGYLKNSMNL